MSAGASEPPAAAVEAAALAGCSYVGPCSCANGGRLLGVCGRRGTMVLHELHALPAADRWQLIGWLAEGLKPTWEMVEAGAEATNAAMGDGVAEAISCITAALAAARDAGDA